MILWKYGFEFKIHIPLSWTIYISLKIMWMTTHTGLSGRFVNTSIILCRLRAIETVLSISSVTDTVSPSDRSCLSPNVRVHLSQTPVATVSIHVLPPHVPIHQVSFTPVKCFFMIQSVGLRQVSPINKHGDWNHQIFTFKTSACDNQIAINGPKYIHIYINVCI